MKRKFNNGDLVLSTSRALKGTEFAKPKRVNGAYSTHIYGKYRVLYTTVGKYSEYLAEELKLVKRAK